MASTAKSMDALMSLVQQVAEGAKAKLAEAASERKRAQRKRATETAEKALTVLAAKLKTLEDEHNARQLKVRSDARAKLAALAESVPSLPAPPEDFGEPVLQPALEDLRAALDDTDAMAKELESDAGGSALGSDADAVIAAALADAQAAVRDRAVSILEAKTSELAGGVARMSAAIGPLLQMAGSGAGMDEDDD